MSALFKQLHNRDIVCSHTPDSTVEVWGSLIRKTLDESSFLFSDSPGSLCCCSTLVQTGGHFKAKMVVLTRLSAWRNILFFQTEQNASNFFFFFLCTCQCERKFWRETWLVISGMVCWRLPFKLRRYILYSQTESYLDCSICSGQRVINQIYMEINR